MTCLKYANLSLQIKLIDNKLVLKIAKKENHFAIVLSLVLISWNDFIYYEYKTMQDILGNPSCFLSSLQAWSWLKVHVLAL